MKYRAMRALFCLAGCAMVGQYALGQAATGEGKPVAIDYLGSAKPIRLEPGAIQTFSVRAPGPRDRQEALRLAEKIFSYSNASMAIDAEATREKEIVSFHNEKDPSAVFNFDLRTGDFIFNRGLAAYKGENETAGLPQAEEAERTALRHLEELGVLAPKDEIVLAHVGGLNMGVHREDGTTSLYRKLVTVRFDRKLAGLPVLGDSRLVVQLGEKGSMAAVIRRWSPVEGRRVAPGELRQVGDIRETIEKRLRAEAGGATDIVVKQTDLVMFDHGKGVIEPAIHVVASMHYQVKMANGKMVGEVRRFDVPYDTFEPVLQKHYAVYPFMHDPNAARLIKTEQRITEDKQQPPPEKKGD